MELSELCGARSRTQQPVFFSGLSRYLFFFLPLSILRTVSHLFRTFHVSRQSAAYCRYIVEIVRLSLCLRLRLTSSIFDRALVDSSARGVHPESDEPLWLVVFTAVYPADSSLMHVRAGAVESTGWKDMARQLDPTGQY